MLLAVASVATGLVIPGRALQSRAVRISAEPPALAYAADKTAVKEDVSEASFVGQFELEEREDADESKTLVELTTDGKVIIGPTDGIPYVSAGGRWEYDGKELILEITRSYEGTTDKYSVTRVFIGDVIALDEIPSQVSVRPVVDKIPIEANNSLVSVHRARLRRPPPRRATTRLVFRDTLCPTTRSATSLPSRSPKCPGQHEGKIT